MPEDVEKLAKELRENLANRAPLTKDGGGLDTQFSNAQLHELYKMESTYFAEGSEYTTVEQRPFKGLVYKRGVKLVHDPKYISHVEIGGGNDLYGICVDYDDFSHMAQVVPLSGCSDLIDMVAKDATIKEGDKVKINDKGEAEKATGASVIIGYADMDSEQKIANKLYMVRVQCIGIKNVNA